MGSAPEESADTSDVQVAVETEVKLDAPRRWTMPRLAGVGRVAEVRGPERFTQMATYLDTMSLALLRNKHTLRRRTGGTDAGWHLKTPGDGSGRVEHRLPLGRSAALVPSALVEEISGILEGHALLPVATLRTRRTRRSLCAADGTVLVLVEDDVVEATTYVEGERIHRWREVEVELVDGAAEDLAAVTDALVVTGLTVSDSKSKLSRALAGPLASVTGATGPRAAGQVVLDYLSQQVGVLQASDRRLREDAPDAVHKARVATRRMRSTFKTYRALLDRTETDPVAEEVKWLTNVLGAPRDAEVLAARISGLLESLEPDLVVAGADADLRRALSEEHDRAHAQMVKALDSVRFERVMADLVDLLLHPPFVGPFADAAPDVLPDLVSRSSGKVSRQADRASAMPDGPERDDAIHTVRKLAKAARYAADAAGTSAGGSAKQIASAFADLQEALGDHQDSVVSRETVMRLAGQARDRGRDTFTYGVLAEREYAVARGVEERYVPLLTAARKAAKKIG